MASFNVSILFKTPPNFDTDTNFIDVAVRRLRSKIDEGHEIKLIHTVRGLGYKISVEA